MICPCIHSYMMTLRPLPEVIHPWAESHLYAEESRFVLVFISV